MNRLRTLALAAALLAASSPALALEQGIGIYGLQLGTGTADLYTAAGPSHITAFDHSELTAGFQYWRMVTDDYATTFSAGLGWFSEVDQARDGLPDVEYTQASWHIRFGGDRVVSVTPRAVLYLGPGFEFWSGGYETKGAGPDFESEKVSRVSLTGRVGGMLLITRTIGINCHVNARLGRARAEDTGAEAAWWPGGVDGGIGVVWAAGHD